MCCSVLQCVAVCCSVLQCAAVCYSVLQCAEFTYIYIYTFTLIHMCAMTHIHTRVLAAGAGFYTVLQCVAVCGSV